MSLWLMILARSSETGSPAWANRPIRWSTVANLVFFLWLAAYPIVRMNCQWIMTRSGHEFYQLPALPPSTSDKPAYAIYYPLLKLESAFSNTTFINPFVPTGFR